MPLDILIHMYQRITFMKSKEFLTIMTERGCPEKCYFCSSADFFGNSGRFRPLNPEKAYEMVELAQSQNLPYSKAIEVQILEDSNDELDLRVGLHQYIYNIGQSSINLNWKINGKIHQQLRVFCLYFLL